MTKEPPIVIEDREELIFMLSEAAALEHMILCEYLFAAFSLKREVSEGVTACQTFAAHSAAPMEVQMNFPRASPHTFASPTFATAQAATESRWLRWKRAWGAWRH